MTLTPATLRQVGMKRKGKRRVPNCVPASSGVTKPRRQSDAETRMDPRGSKVAAKAKRTDAATDRLDKKCGASGIADNKTCHVGKGKGPVERLRAANKTWEARYGKRPKASNKDKLKALGIAALAAGAGVGAAALVSKMRNKGNKPAIPFNLGNVRVPKPGVINKSGTASGLARAADRGRLNELESLARGNNPALEAQMQVSKARNAEARKSLKNSRAELQRLRTEIGVWGPNRIRPFKRKRRDSIWATGFEP